MQSHGHDSLDDEHLAAKDPRKDDGTLKYHLLGPSLTKAGQDAVDQRKVSQPAGVVQY